MCFNNNNYKIKTLKKITQNKQEKNNKNSQLFAKKNLLNEQNK
jgi:hypothetical protein